MINIRLSSKVKLSVFLSRFFGYAKKQMLAFSLAFIGYGLYAFSQPAFAMLMEAFVRALEGEYVDSLYLVPLMCVAIALLRGFGSYLGSYYMSKVGANIVHGVRCDMYENIVRLPMKFFDDNKSGRLVSLFTYNSNLMITSTTQSLKTIGREGLTVIALLGYLFYQSASLTLTFLLLGPPIALAVVWISKKVKQLGHGIQASTGELNHVAAETFSGIRQVKSSANEGNEKDRFFQISDLTKRLGLKLAKFSAIYTPFMQVMVIIVMALIMYIVLLYRGSMDTAQLVAYVTAVGLLPKPIRSLSEVHPKLLEAAVAAEEVFTHIDLEQEQDQGEIDNVNLLGKLSFNQVSFAYKNDQLALEGVDFQLDAGKTLAIVGRSGGGKSTLVNLITRFYLPTQGEVRIDDVSINQYKLAFLRGSISMVSQQVVLFNDSIKANIAYGADDVTESEIVAAAKAANADEFINGFPQAYDTIVGENGAMLSGGQRQRIAIARAILSDARLLILDEATSALDNESEVKVQLALESLMKDRTTIVIAHRLSTIENADHILLLDDGKIVEQGSHEQLMQVNGLYSRMVLRDFIDA
ncbi:MAG: lipid ABC transporter permease/ATP-binding protein [Cellvibrionales bacterium]|nr:lipid ABC transporter permease/ATP-binding protein [Cellvibrionales bacterium]